MASLFKFLLRFYFKKTGWVVKGEIPEGTNKAVLIGGAHTSNWDLIFSLGTMFTINRQFKFLIKKEAVVFPLKSFLLSMGALPIDRSPDAKMNYVDQLAEVFSAENEMFLCIAPEGTRKATKKWKTGYYHIAKKANVPVIVCYLDYNKKVANIGCVLHTDMDEPELTQAMKEELKKAGPKIPENFQI